MPSNPIPPFEDAVYKRSWKNQLRVIIFEADTFWGKFFDIALLVTILLSVFVVMLESVKEIGQSYGWQLKVLEWVFTVLFTLEYIARIVIVKKKWSYVSSFFGIVDLLSILPTYLSIVFTGTQSLVVLRSLRLLRVFRVLKLARYLTEATNLKAAMAASKIKIFVFIGTVFISVVIMGTLMYLIEGGTNGFTSIPRSIYWAIVTLTTVGYGDIAPQTVIGQMMASVIMIMGYGIIAVPTGIVSAEMVRKAPNREISTTSCSHCNRDGHDYDAEFCKYCGKSLDS